MTRILLLSLSGLAETKTHLLSDSVTGIADYELR